MNKEAQMQIKVTFSPQEGLRLPMADNHLLQSMLYDLLSDRPNLSAWLHNEGYQEGKRSYKPFVFSQLQGSYSRQGRNREYSGDVSLEIRTVDEEIFTALYGALLERRSIQLAGQLLDIIGVEIRRKQLDKGRYRIRMLSPIVVHETTESGKTRYYHPQDDEFGVRLLENCRRKYQAFYKKELDGDFTIRALRFSEKNKVVTRYKGFYITCWRGDFELVGPPHVLDFLYQVGLGEKGSMGFGAFRILEEQSDDHI